MKKFLVFVLAVLILLTACATAQSTNVTPAPTKIVYVTPDTSMVTPEVGFAEVLEINGVSAVLLRSQPDIQSPLSGKVHPGERGKLLGIDPSGKWVLVKIGDRTGWAPFQLFALTIAE